MKVVVIGGTGTIGKAVVVELGKRHEVISVGHSNGDYQLDISDQNAVESLLSKLAPIDAIVSTAGLAKFGQFDQLSDNDYQLGLQNKLMGQVNLARLGPEFLSPNGSITLTSGVLAQMPMPGSSSISLVNAAVEGFTRAAALEFPQGKRINTVSPPFVKETMEAMGMDSTHGLPAAQLALSYAESVEGDKHGQIITTN